MIKKYKVIYKKYGETLEAYIFAKDKSTARHNFIIRFVDNDEIKIKKIRETSE
jgi:hypothetical protein